MFEHVNRAVWAVRAAMKEHAGDLRFIQPVRTGEELRRLMSHLIVVRAALKLNPGYSKRLTMALHGLIREVEQDDAAAAEMCPGCKRGCFECAPYHEVM